MQDNNLKTYKTRQDDIWIKVQKHKVRAQNVAKLEHFHRCP